MTLYGAFCCLYLPYSQFDPFGGVHRPNSFILCQWRRPYPIHPPSDTPWMQLGPIFGLEPPPNGARRAKRVHIFTISVYGWGAPFHIIHIGGRNIPPPLTAHGMHLKRHWGHFYVKNRPLYVRIQCRKCTYSPGSTSRWGAPSQTIHLPSNSI